MSEHEEEQDKNVSSLYFFKVVYNPTSFLDFEWVQTVFLMRQCKNHARCRYKFILDTDQNIGSARKSCAQ